MGLDFYSCCADEPADGAAAYFVAASGTAPDIEFIGAKVDQPAVSRPRCLRIARHESAHAVVAMIAGAKLEGIEIDPRCHCRNAAIEDRAARIVYLLAGPAADAWHRSEIARMTDDALAPWLAGIRLAMGGGCDHCRAIRSCLAGTRFADDATVIAEFRRLEALAGMLVRHPAVWAAIDAIADRLMAAGSLDGATATEIAVLHFNPAELRPFLES